MKKAIPIGRDMKPVILFLASGSLLYLVTSIPALHRHVVIPFTEFGAWMWCKSLNFLGEDVVQNGTIVTDPVTNFSLKILDGCNGLFASIILIAAMLAHRAGIRAKLLGVGAGLVVIFLANQVRLVALFWIGRGLPDFLEPAHVFVGPALMILVALTLWLSWAEWIDKGKKGSLCHEKM